MARYSSASLWADSERSVGRDEDVRIEMAIEMEFCSTRRQCRQQDCIESTYDFDGVSAPVLLEICLHSL
jgi:hypothetical protein